jgi:hypothetical protein
MRQSGSALRKLFRSLAAAAFWSGVANDEKQDLPAPLRQRAHQGYRDRLQIGPVAHGLVEYHKVEHLTPFSMSLVFTVQARMGVGIRQAFYTMLCEVGFWQALT